MRKTPEEQATQYEYVQRLQQWRDRLRKIVEVTTSQSNLLTYLVITWQSSNMEI